jgi:hypothetical protein
MTKPPELDINDLIGKEKLDRSLKTQIEQAVETGDMAPDLCLELSRLCNERGYVSRAMWFLATCLKSPLEFSKEQLDSVIKTLIRLIENIDEKAQNAELFHSLTDFFLTLDRISPRANENIVQLMVQGLAMMDSAMETICDETMATDKLLKCPSFLSVVLASNISRGRLDKAATTARRLEDLPKITRYAYSALAKFSLLHGDTRQARNILAEGMNRTEEDYQILFEYAALSYCLEEEKEARRTLSRALEFALPGLAEKRRLQISGWTKKLKEAIEKKLTDGDGIRQIGASINYSEPDIAAKIWREHRDSCVKKNEYQSIGAYTNKVMYGYIERLISQDDGLSKIINYGVSCGILEFAMAERYRDLCFAGFDIAETATELNKKNYSKDNLVFGSDLNSLLDSVQKREGKSLLTHCRTMDIMFPEAVKNVYRACHGHGVDLILSAEYFSLSFDTLNYPDFSENPIDTVHWDGILVIHNLDKIFAETGYRIIDRKFVPLPLFVSVTGEGRHSSMLIQLVLAERVVG